ncbi:putative lipid transfer protein [Ascobolus immersus RN42]|uniref:Putative lipid transfer protein n=1 Tax=Ascobolus immersus RN42 TaxID=1160509 RepID=A0A3N4IGZ0_ASCIM|nr:putative lipid transfer protein [Ascobolus immersus RN42]
MAISNSAFPSSTLFDLLSQATQDAGFKKSLLKSGTLFAFTITNSAGETASWFVDGKESATVGTGTAPAGKQPDVTLQLSDENFQKLADEKAKPQQLFMSGKLKIKGNMMKATKLEPVLKDAKSLKAKAKL